jgi:putative glycosyl hydrolase-like family 15 (GHL15) protein
LRSHLQTRSLTSVALASLTLAGCNGTGTVPPVPKGAQLPVAAFAPRREQFPPTRSGFHLNLVFNYLVKDLHREVGLIDVVWGARSSNPKRVYNQFYTPFERDGPYGTSHDLYWWKRSHRDWIEYRCDRRTVAFEFGERRDVPFDIANPAVLAYQRASAVDAALAVGYRGVDFDNLELGNYWHRCGHFNAAGGWVRQYTGKPTDPQYTNDVLTWARSTFAYIHRHSRTATMAINFSYDSGFTDRTNYALAVATDEVLDESGFTNYGTKGRNVTTPREWREIAGLIRAVQANNGCYVENGEEPALSKNITQAERLWVVGNYLLIRDDCTYVWTSGFTRSGAQDYGRILLYPEYSLAVGEPAGSAQRAGDAWQRAYSGGLSIVNPSNRSVTIPLHGSYVDENGKRYASSITLPKTSGEILLRK